MSKPCPHDRKDPPGWRFAVPDETKVFASVRVLQLGYAILMVCHDDDGDWVFSCGTTSESAHAVVTCLGCLVEADPSLAALADLPRGWLAYRLDPAAEWERGPLPDDDDAPPDTLFPW
jgi:hypothetical protein